MEAVKFTLSGKTAFFKKPEVNSYYYFTYGCIHKVVLLGIFGAILGLDGYGQRNEKSNEYPEFYEKLHHMKVAIVPNAKDAYISKKMQIFNNTVGYASKELGGTLNVKQQWLEEPSWDIFFLIEDEITKRLADQILSKKTVYMPYLGSNDHLADITETKRITDLTPLNNYAVIHSIFEKNKAVFADYEDYMDDMEVQVYQYEEALPVSLDPAFHMYQSINFMATNLHVSHYEYPVYSWMGKNVVFF